MNDYLRENLSYFGIYGRLLTYKKHMTPERVEYGTDKEQYFLYYEPEHPVSDKIIYWVHGGGWNAGNPKFFDYVGQHVSNAGYRMISGGYRLAPWNKYPVQLEDVCSCYNKAVTFLKDRNIDTSKIIVVGPSAGAHLTSLLCYSGKVQKKYHVDISSIIGFIGFGGPYSFRSDLPKTLSLLINQLFRKNYNRAHGEPVSMMTKNHIPSLLIQSRHDGLVPFECAEDFAARAAELGNRCELYSVEDKKNTHSWYTAGLFFEDRSVNKGLDKFFSWIEELSPTP
ncbi:MAG: alpha/beta hydrolase [Lachnospiraceae bacterium]|nr:alpha/beta hydrolase [Lachnospiraceae bacterium]